MTKAQNMKPLVRSKLEKSKSLKSLGEATSSLGKGRKGLKATSVKESIKDKKRQSTNPTTATFSKVTSACQKHAKSATKSRNVTSENSTITKEQRHELLTPPENLKKKKSFDKQKVLNGQTKRSNVRTKKVVEKSYEAIPVDEEAFDSIVCQANVLEMVNSLKTLLDNQMAAKKTSIFGDYNYYLNVSSFKIPNCPKRLYKLNLKHAMVDPGTDDVLIVVPDLKRGAKVDIESTIEHYTNLFQEAGIHGLKIMPLNQLRNEYKAFEAKRNLASTYDYYLCDGRISGHVVGFCGKIFQKPRTTFHTVRINNINSLKVEIEKSLCRTAYKLVKKGDLISIPIGSEKHTLKQVVENILYVISQLKESFAGGLENIRGIDIKVNIRGISSLPIFTSTSGGPDVVPYIVGPREQRMLKLKKQANQVLSKFTITKEADVLQLNKVQIERKRKFREFRSAIISYQSQTSDANKDDSLNSEIPIKKLRKDVKLVEKKKREIMTKKVNS